MKPIAKKPSPRRFHQARWDEPIIFELSQPGQRGVLLPPVEAEIEQQVGQPGSRITRSITAQNTACPAGDVPDPCPAPLCSPFAGKPGR